MQAHPMPEFGSFSLLLALILTAYNLVVGGLALWGSTPRGQRALRVPEASWNRLGETARRAGIASFAALCCAAFALVWAAFTNDFSVEYIRSHSNIALNPAYKFAALWSGQERPARERPDAEIVCECASVTAGTIRLAIAGGCKTADEVSCKTGASRGCGSCLPVVSLMLASSERRR